MSRGSRRSYSKQQVLGFVGGFVPFLISLLTTVFLTMINFYYCYAISIGALLCFLLFSFGAIQHNRSTHVLIMMVYTAFFEVVLIVFSGMFIYYCFEPQIGPFCKVCTQHTKYRMDATTQSSLTKHSKTTLSPDEQIALECEGPCRSGVESVVVVCVFSLCFAVNFFCLIRMWQFRYYLRGLEQRAAQGPQSSNNVWATGDDIFDFPEISENGPPPYYNINETGDSMVPPSEAMHMDMTKQFYGKTGLSMYCAPLPSYSEVSAPESGTNAPPIYEETTRQTIDSRPSNRPQECSPSNSTAS